MKCCLKTCKLPSITPHHKRVELKGTIKSEFKKVEHKCQVRWPSNGEIMFHRDCWDAVFTAAAVEKSKKTGMTYIEKEMLKEAATSAEFFDSQEQVKEAAKKLAELIKSASFAVCFTGAGISTSAGIGDFRGKKGKWTEEDRDVKAERKRPSEGKKVDDSPRLKRSKVSNASGDAGPSDPAAESNRETDEADVEDGVPYEKLRPTYTHEAIAWLTEKGYFKHTISQNGDGLHALSGIPDEKLSELHGNVFIEVCQKCKHRYKRPYYVLDDAASQYYEELEDFGASEIVKPAHAELCSTCGLSHGTGRTCSEPGCKGVLRDTIVNFRDLLDEEQLSACRQHMLACDLVVCLGSTLAVRPANSLLSRVKRLVIVNRQPTHLDKKCSSDSAHCFGDCDVVFRLAMPLIMGEDECHKWQEARGQRMRGYDEQRQAATE